MISHERAIDLSASALDFELSPTDEAELTAHLEACESCRTVSSALRSDAAAISGLAGMEAPAALRGRIFDAIASPEAVTAGTRPDDIAPAVPTLARPTVLGSIDRFRARLRPQVLMVAAAAVIVALVAGTLAWQTRPGNQPIAGVNPSPRTSAGASTEPGAPGSAGPVGSPDPHVATDWSPVAELTPSEDTGGVVPLDGTFVLASRGSTPAVALARRLSVRPALDLVETVEADGRVRLTPSEPLTPGAVYRFSLAGDEGQTLDSWAFQASQPLRVVGTLPNDTATDVPLDTGIEVTFDQDGVVDAADHVTIEPTVSGRVEQHGRVLAFAPDRLAPATVYTVTVSRGVTVGATHETLQQDVRFRFETAALGEPPVEATRFTFATDLYETATRDRPMLSLWAITDWDGEGEEPALPDAARIEVYRFADRAAAIDAFRLLERSNDWSRWNNGGQVDSSALSRVAGFDVPLVEHDGTLVARLPEPLRAGWYLAQVATATRPVQAVLQVTDIAGYLLVAEGKTIVWANDLGSGTPIAGATVAVDGSDIGRTTADGSLLVPTPAALLPSESTTCADACDPAVTIDADGMGAFLPGAGVRGVDGKGDLGVYVGGGEADAGYWRVLHSDRTIYRRTDTINLWGVVRARDTGTVPGTATVRLRAAVDDGGNAAPPIATLALTPSAVGAFTGSIKVADLPEGSYQLDLEVGRRVIASQGLSVQPILKPAYRLDVVTGRRVYIAGDRIRVTARATFFDGTPVPGVQLRMTGAVEARPTTDSTGTAIVRTLARVGTDEDDDGGPRQTEVSVQPARAEEGEIAGATREFVIFPSSWTIAASSEIRAGRVRLTGTLNAVDVERMEAAIASGTATWDLDPRGAPMARRAVRATFIELIPVRTQIGTTYDFIEKKVVPAYDYSTTERRAGTRRLTTDAKGRFSASIAAGAGGHAYRVEITAVDPDRHTAKAQTVAESTLPSQASEPSLSFGPTSGPPDVDVRYGIGDTIDLTLRDPVPAAGTGRQLFYVAQSDVREVTVQDAARFRMAFPAWGAPNLVIGAVRFTGRGYEVAPSYNAPFRSADRALSVDLRADRSSYRPGDRVTLSIRTRDARGRPAPATVVLRGVDEKLFVIGAAEATDTLSELYANLSPAIRSTYLTHLPPQGEGFGGGDTGGGDERSDLRDSLLFRAVETDADGRATLSFPLSDDLTSWHVSASAIGAQLRAGEGTVQIPVSLPFFVDAAIAPQYLRSDRPAIQVRAFGDALKPGDRVTVSVDSASLGLHRSDLRTTAFTSLSVPLPPLAVGTHTVTISVRTGSGAATRRDRLTRTFEVVGSRLTRGQTAYGEPTASERLRGGADLTDLIVSDAGAGRLVAMLADVADAGGARLERALGADIAAGLLATRFADRRLDPSAPTFDGARYQNEDGGLAILPYASSDLDASVLAALVAPDRFQRLSLASYFRTILLDPKETRERQSKALAGLAGLGESVLPAVRTALDQPALTLRERLILAQGAAALGDEQTARAVARDLAARLGEGVGDQARLRAGENGADVTAATASMAMLMAALADPAAPRYWAYVQANQNTDVTYALHAVGFAQAILARLSPQPATFALTVDGDRRVVDLAAGETFRSSLTARQLAGATVEPLTGSIGVTTSWRTAVASDELRPDPDLAITRTVTPAGTIRASDLVVVDLQVRFGPQAPTGCHVVTDLAPSGLVPVGMLRTWMDPETGDAPIGVTYPESQTGQRVTFCADSGADSRTARLRYIARVISVGSFAWEPAVVESRADPDLTAVTARQRITIR